MAHVRVAASPPRVRAGRLTPTVRFADVQDSWNSIDSIVEDAAQYSYVLSPATGPGETGLGATVRRGRLTPAHPPLQATGTTLT